MVIRNATIYGVDHQFHQGDIHIVNSRIKNVDINVAVPENEELIDATNLYAIPGLIDIHLHGAAGYDFCTADEAGIREISEYEMKHGIAAMCPTTMTLAEDVLEDICGRILREYQKQCSHRVQQNNIENKAAIVGIHMEGPFINQEKAGAQNKEYIAGPDVDMFDRLQLAAGGLIKQIDIAPEVDGGLRFIEKLGNRQTHSAQPVISLAHTDCDYDQATIAFQKGASHLTHTFNAMPGIDKRNPGPIIAAKENNADVELIADGVHIHPAMVRFAFDYFGEDKVILISDSMEATGLPDGTYKLGGLPVRVQGNLAVLAKEEDDAGRDKSEEQYTIAGSVTNLFDCMRIAVSDMGVPLESAIRAATENPAKSIGIFDDYGSIECGKLANILLVDNDLRLVHVINEGLLYTEEMTYE